MVYKFKIYGMIFDVKILCALDAAELYTLCRTAVYGAGFGEAVRPDDILSLIHI